MDKETLQELERKKKYLKRYRKNVALVSRLKKKLELLTERSYSLKSPTLSGMPRGGDLVTLSDRVADKTDLEARINRLTIRGRDLKTEITECIDNLDDARYAEILESFFIECKDFDQIASESGYTERHVIRLYSEGILSISL